MDGSGGHYAKSDGQRQILYDFTYMWNLKAKQMNKHNKTNTENNRWLPEGRGVGE